MREFLRFIDGPVLGSLLRWAIRVYQLTLGLVFRGACRFYPSCSRYSEEAIAKYGAMGGVWLTARRLLRCQPFHPGGADPVP